MIVMTLGVSLPKRIAAGVVSLDIPTIAQMSQKHGLFGYTLPSTARDFDLRRQAFKKRRNTPMVHNDIIQYVCDALGVKICVLSPGKVW